MFFEFTQNNSGGRFEFNSIAGISHRVLIEAENKDQAIEKALNIGLYFDGCEKGIDCPCCGDRWDDWTDQITDIDEYVESVKNFTWLSPDIYTHHNDGSIEGRLFKE